MPVTVRDLLDLPKLGLTVVAGEPGLDHAIRWAHTSELQDPTPWLSGGEFLLTTGMGLKGSAALQRAYIRRLVGANLAGLGFGVGFDFDEVPAPIRRAADNHGFPVLVVPYPVPFIAITEAVSSRLTADRLREVQLSVEVHERLAALVLEGSGPADVLDEVVALAGGWAVLFDGRGRALAAAAAPGADPPAPEGLWSSIPEGLRTSRGPATAAESTPHGTRVALPVVADKHHHGVLAFGKDRRLNARDRMVVHHALTVLGLLLASRRAVIDAEWRIAGDILSDAIAGRFGGDDLERRLERIGFLPGAPVTVLVVEGGAATDAQAIDEVAWAVDSSLGARARPVRTTVVRDRVVAALSHPNAEELSQVLLHDLERADLPATDDGFRIGLGEPTEPRSLRHSYLTALFALRAAPSSRSIASPRDLGSYSLLLGAQSRPVLEGLVRSVLGPLLDWDRTKSSHLVDSVRAYIAAGGRWETGAEELGIHRHTLRYRVRQAEELLERDLASEEDRLEVWLALKAAEILRE